MSVWQHIEKSSAYQGLDDNGKAKLRRDYFTDFIVSDQDFAKLPQPEREKVYLEFVNQGQQPLEQPIYPEGIQGTMARGISRGIEAIPPIDAPDVSTLMLEPMPDVTTPTIQQTRPLVPAHGPEDDFKNWYAIQSQKFGFNPDPDDPRHFYDWRSAYQAGAEADETGHWPSEFKLPGHPNLIVEGMDTRTGKPYYPETLQPTHEQQLAEPVQPRPPIYDEMQQFAQRAGIGPGRPQVPEWFRKPSEYGFPPIPTAKEGLEASLIEGLKETARFGAKGRGLYLEEMGAGREQFGKEISEFAQKAGIGPERKPQVYPETEFGQKLIELSKRPEIQADPMYRRRKGWVGWFDDLIKAGPQMADMMAHSIALGPLGGMSEISNQILAGTYENLRNQGVEHKRAFGAGLANAMMQAPLEYIGISKIAGVFKPQKAIVQKLKNIAEAAGTEWLTELTQAYPELITEIYAKNPDKTELEKWDKITDKWWEATKQGAYEGTLTAPWAVLGMAAPTVDIKKPETQPGPDYKLFDERIRVERKPEDKLRGVFPEQKPEEPISEPKPAVEEVVPKSETIVPKPEAPPEAAPEKPVQVPPFPEPRGAQPAPEKPQPTPLPEVEKPEISQIAEPEIEKKVEKQKYTAKKLRRVALSTKERAEEKYNADRLKNTVRRARMAASARADAARDIQIAETMLKIADGLESGEIKALSQISAKTQVEQLDQILKMAQHKSHDKKYPEYSEKQQHKDDPVVAEDVKFAEYPNIRIHDTMIAGVRRDLEAHRGGKKIANQIQGYYINYDLAKQILDFAKKNNIKTLPWTIESDYKQISALRRMGIENTEQLKEALTELVGLRAGRKKEDPIKTMERELIGTKIQGFFPTPETLADRLVAKAGIDKGMAILEPSAGTGSIADSIRKAGHEPDVIEIVPQLEKILTAKNYEVVSSDFLEFDSKKYDRIIMNPPFEKGQDVDHVKHAYDLLKPGGRIIAIMSESPFFRSEQKYQDFRDWLDEVDGYSEKLEAGSFKGAKQLRETGVNARLVTIEKAPEKPAEIKIKEPKPSEVEEVEKPKIEVAQYDHLADVEVPIKAIREKTGEEITVRDTAKNALEKIDSDIEKLNKIVECLEQ